MDTRPKDVATIIGEAIEIASPAERESYLANVCGGDAVLRRHVDQLLDDHAQAGDFLEKPAVQGAPTVDMPQIAEQPGAVIGPYKLLEQIGEGGFGIVYMADQQAPVRRRVALKIIKPGMDTKQVLARFKAELQALSLMDHPNIARALDAGATDTGRPYFVMELVRGVPITEYCDQNNLPVHERLDLFVQVCHAVQHAHQKGIIHRDIKPSNVLVTLNDGRPVPKVIDFGVAKAINQQLTPETIFTRFAEMIGTPLYMSPEQAEMTSLDIDTRADIYSLGVLLYELLTGSTPFDKNRLKRAAFDEIRRIIREENPPKPSLRISTLGDTRTAVAAHRHVDPNRLSQLVSGDLDWIVMKALEKDRTRRYDTASNFAADVLRYLSDRPVEACPPSAVYRFRKFARRNRVALTTAAIVLLTLILGIVGSVAQTIRATRAERLSEARFHDAEQARRAEADQRQIAEAQKTEADKSRRQAEANFRKAQQVTDFLVKLFEGPQTTDWMGFRFNAIRKLGSEMTARELLDRGAQRAVNELKDQPDVQITLLNTIGHIYGSLGYVKQAEPLLRESLKRRRELLGPDHLDVADTIEHLAWLSYNKLDFGQASQLHREALAIRRKQLGDQHLLVADSLFKLGFALAVSNQFPEAEDCFRRSLAIRQKQLSPSDRDVAFSMGGVGWTLLHRKNVKDGKPLVEQAEKLFSQIDGGENLGAAVNRLVMLSLTDPPADVEQQLDAVVAKIRRTMGEEHPVACIFLVYQTSRLRGLRRYAAAAKAASLNLALIYRIFGESAQSEQVLATLLDCLRLQSKDVSPAQLNEIIELYRQALEVSKKFVASHPDRPADRDRLARTHFDLAEVLRAVKRPGDAAEHAREAIGLWEKLAAQFPPGENFRMAAGHTLWQLGYLASDAGRHEEAEKYHRRALAVFEKLATDFPQNRFCRQEQGYSDWNIAGLMRRQNRLSDAEKAFRDALDVYSKLVAEAPNEGVYRDREAVSRLNLAGVLVLVGRPKEAEQQYAKILEVNPKSASAHNNLAWMLATSAETKLRDPARAVVLAKKAVDLEPKQGMWWNTLGAAQYQAGDWKAAVEALKKSMELRNGGDSFDWFFLAMAQWQLKQKDEARKRYDQAVAWMDKNKPQDEELKRFRAEAAEMLGSKQLPAPETKKEDKPAK